METRSIPEDLMLELEDAIEKVNHLFSKVNALNERHQNNEYREWNRDYERSIAC